MTEPDDPTLDTARNLRAIVELSRFLRGQAVSRAGAHDMPGGAAMAELGPVANVGAVEMRNRLDEAAWCAKHGEDWCEEHETVMSLCEHRFNPWNDDVTTLTTLRWWTEEYRARTDAVTERWTIASETAWLVDNLRWVYDNEPHFEDLAKDIATARAALESILHAGERDERTRVPCIDCDETRDGKPLRVLLVVHYAGAMPNWVCPACKRKGSEDHWYCPRCRRQYDESSLRLAEHYDLERQTGSDWQPVDLAASALEVPVWTVKRIATACDISSRSLLVRWPEARAWHRRRQLSLPETTAV